MKDDSRTMTDAEIHEEIKSTVQSAIEVGPQRQVKMTIATLVGIGLTLLSLAGIYYGFKAEFSSQRMEITQLRGEIENLKDIPTQVSGLDRRMLAMEIQLKFQGGGSVTNTGQGGTVNMNTENERQELREKPELKTSELARLLGVTSETITNNIKKDSTGEPIHFEYLGKQYEVRKSGNTFVIENPQYEP